MEHRGRGKLERALYAITMGQGGRILLPSDVPGHKNPVTGVEEPGWVEGLCRQLASFTGAADCADDLVDALAYLAEEATLLRPATGTVGTGPCKLDEGRQGGFNAPWTTAPGMGFPPGPGGW